MEIETHYDNGRVFKDIEYFQEDDYTEFLENDTYKDVVEGYVDSGFWEWNEDKSAILFDKNKSYEN